MGTSNRFVLVLIGAWFLFTSTTARCTEDENSLPPLGWASKQPANKTDRVVKDFRALQYGKLSPKEKDDKVWEILANLAAALPDMKDPFAMTNDAALLMSAGVMQDVNTLEFAGPDEVVEARLRWRADGVYVLLDKAHKDSAALAAGLEAKINMQNKDAWDRLDQLAANSEYSRNLMTYALALSLPPVRRRQFVDPAIKSLKELDNKDSTVMPQVHLMLGKLHMVLGETDVAITLLQEVASKDSKIDPPPTAERIFDARYTIANAELLAGHLDPAQAALDAMGPWTRKELAPDAETQRGTSGALAMLQYRIDLARSQRSTGLQRNEWRSKADQVLIDLEHTRPDLKTTIQRMRIAHYPADVPIGSIPPEMLESLLGRAYELADYLIDPSPSSPTLLRGLEAARELLTRSNRTGITASMTEAATRVTGVILEMLDRKPEAVRAFLNYAVSYPTDPPEAALWSLDEATSLVTGSNAKANDPETARLGVQIVAAYRSAAAKFNNPTMKAKAIARANVLEKLVKP